MMTAAAKSDVTRVVLIRLIEATEELILRYRECCLAGVNDPNLLTSVALGSLHFHRASLLRCLENTGESGEPLTES